ncbi:hypothetical protein HanHA89_Chr05g0171901 [Helianthus annuus]|nr:hypothetical protein HanHA89_Chr05g0171901 [Helianthus annuus]
MRALNRCCLPSPSGTTNITLKFGWTATTSKSVGSDQTRVFD